MLELNSKPKKLEIQRHTKANNWITESVITRGENDNRSFSVDDVFYWHETFEIPSDDNNENELYNVRVLNDYGKVILSTASHDFLFRAGRSSHITVHYPLDNKTEVYSKINPVMKHIREFQRYIGRQNGIKSVKEYERDKNDGGIQVYRVNFKNGTYVTVGVYPIVYS